MISAQLSPETRLQTWRIVSTPPWSGEENMAHDLRTLRAVQEGALAPTLRFFRWSEPTVSYGKHQSLATIASKIPADCATVQRPTGGGIVLHGSDLCFSLCWRAGQHPLPVQIKDHYQWIHSIALKALGSTVEARLARRQDCAPEPGAFATRECFTQPVGYDILKGEQKILGGALCRQKNTFLYQGSIQGIDTHGLEDQLQDVFQHALTA